MLAKALQGGTSAAKTYVDDVFSTYLYTGNGSTQTITNGIDLAGQGGLVWIKARSASGYNHALFDTERGVNNRLKTDTTDAQNFSSAYNNTFNGDGFSIGAQYVDSGVTYASWTFRKAPKFFDVVTYTGNGNSLRDINHNLGSTPGCVIIKRLNSASNWHVMHRYSNSYFLRLNQTTAEIVRNGSSNVLTSTTFSVQTGELDAADDTNINGATYVAYLFAHDTAADGLIQCGSFTTDSGGNATVSLGWEPQWVMLKSSSNAGTSWQMFDAMRGMTAAGQNDALLQAQATTAEITNSDYCSPTATGFAASGQSGSATYIYIAIRRPNKPPTSGTQVYNATANSNAINSTTAVALTPEASDLWINSGRGGSTGKFWLPRLTGWEYLSSTGTGAEDTSYTWDQLTQSNLRPTTTWWDAGTSQINWFFRRAPGFFDVVCYTGDGVNGRSLSHNLGVVPEMIIVKCRNTGGVTYGWPTYHSAIGGTAGVFLNTNDAKGNGFWPTTGRTSSAFSVVSSTDENESAKTYVAYLFASLPGISKVGSYTGNGGTVNNNGTSQTVNCGFAAGARFVLIKRTDSSGDWYVFDSARGIVAGNDPYLLLNSTAAEVTTVDAVDADNSGFIVNQTSGTNLNVTNATYIYLAIA